MLILFLFFGRHSKWTYEFISYIGLILEYFNGAGVIFYDEVWCFNFTVVDPDTRKITRRLEKLQLKIIKSVPSFVVNIYIYIYIYMCVCVCVYIYIYISSKSANSIIFCLGWLKFKPWQKKHELTTFKKCFFRYLKSVKNRYISVTKLLSLIGY